MSKKPEWERLMVEAQNGNSQMYNLLLRELADYLIPYLRGRIRPDEVAQEVMQEVLISIHKARHTYDPGFPFKPWLFKIVQSRLIDHFRKNGSKQNLTSTYDEHFLEAIAAEAEISHLNVVQLQKALENLSEDQREILTALKLEGKSIREVSVAMKMSEAAVKVAAHRGYARLYDLLEVEP